MKEQINDLLLKMQSGESCIGNTANDLLNLFEARNSINIEAADTETIEALYDFLSYINK